MTCVLPTVDGAEKIKYFLPRIVVEKRKRALFNFTYCKLHYLDDFIL